MKRVWFFLICWAKKKHAIYFFLDDSEFPRLRPCTVRRLTFRKHGSYARNNHFVVDTRRYSVDFREKKKATNSSNAFMKTSIYVHSVFFFKTNNFPIFSECQFLIQSPTIEMNRVETPGPPDVLVAYIVCLVHIVRSNTTYHV